jgi:hypothetical protein
VAVAVAGTMGALGWRERGHGMMDDSGERHEHCGVRLRMMMEFWTRLTTVLGEGRGGVACRRVESRVK